MMEFTNELGGTMAPAVDEVFAGIVEELRSEAEARALGSEAMKPFVPGEVETEKSKVMWGSAQSSGEEDSDSPPAAL